MKRSLGSLVLLLLSVLIAGCATSQAQPLAHVSLVNTDVRNGYRLEIQNSDPTLNTYIANAQQEFTSVYPQLVTRWSANPSTAPRVVTLSFKKNLGFPASTSANLIQVDIDYAHTNPYDPGVLTHELTHVVQGYPTYIVWLTEAIANYSSQLYGPRREEVFRSASKFVSGTTYLSNPYDTGSRFLFWLAQNKRHDIVDRLNRILQANTYTPNVFVQLTGDTLDQLWAQFLSSGGNVFTLQHKNPQQIYQSLTALTPALTTPIAKGDVANWETLQGNNYSCGFEGNSYNVHTTEANTFLSCRGLNTAGHNFAYQAEMTILQGDSGGIIGRGVSTDGLRFCVGSNGTYDLTNGQTTLVPEKHNAAIKQGKQKNTLLMVVEDRNIYLYINGQYLGNASDTYTGGGYFGFMAVDFGNATSVNYQNVKIWQW